MWWLIGKWLLSGASFLFALALAEGPPPNFVLIFTDDVGFGDLACYGHPYAKTDNINRLAKEGTLFRQFHVNGNICPVTRSGLMTSRHPAWFPNYPEEFGFLGTLTVTKVLQRAGYTTGHIGKWNIGPDPSEEQGDYGIDHLRVLSDSTYNEEGREQVRVNEAIAFLEQNKDRPFYLNLWMMALHTPIIPPQSFIDQFQDLIVNRSDFGFHMQENFDLLESQRIDIDETMRGYLADLLALDVQVGRLLDKLDELGISENTVVVFSSDNGPADVEKAPKTLGYAGGLRGGKHNFYEGGTRVPFIVRWPGRVPAGRVDDESIMSGLDWLTTVSSLAGAPYPANLVEGEDMSDVWLGATRSRADPLLFRVIGPNGPVFIRYGRWKFHHRTNELYELSKDPFEQTNVASERPDVVAALSSYVAEWVTTLPNTYVRKPIGPASFDPMEPVQLVTLPNITDAFPSYSSHASPSYSSPSNSSPSYSSNAFPPKSSTVVPGVAAWMPLVLGVIQFLTMLM